MIASGVTNYNLIFLYIRLGKTEELNGKHSLPRVLSLGLGVQILSWSLIQIILNFDHRVRQFIIIPGIESVKLIVVNQK